MFWFLKKYLKYFQIFWINPVFLKGTFFKSIKLIDVPVNFYQNDVGKGLT